MREQWVYYMLLNESGMVVGFSRETRTRTQYASLRSERWRREVVPHVDRVALQVAPLGLRLLKGCR
jgi:hypothetical protein